MLPLVRFDSMSLIISPTSSFAVQFSLDIPSRLQLTFSKS